MYTLSIYTQWFRHNEEWYLYNAQSNFFSKVAENLINLLRDREWDAFDNDTIRFLLERHIIEHSGNEYDYFMGQMMMFNARNYDPTHLNLVIAPTTACNFNCPYCFEPKLKPHTMSDDTISALFDFVRMHDKAQDISLTWYGGEPLLAFSQIKKIMDGLTAEGMPKIKHMSLVTNASLLSEDVCRYFSDHKLNHMQVTFDGIREHHDSTRCFKANGAPSFGLIYDNLKKAQKILADCNISLRINVNKTNLDDFVDMYRFVKTDFKDNPNVSIYPGLIREDTPDGKSLRSGCIQSEDMMSTYSYLKSRGIDCHLFPSLQRRGCMLHCRNAYIIGPEGEIYKCWNDVSSPDKVVGHISAQRLDNPSLLVKYMVGSTPFTDECRRCSVFPICDGNCGYYQYRNRFEGASYRMCSSLRNPENLKQALLEKCLTRIVGIKED